MELRTMRAFVEVVRQGSFSRAAKSVFASQSTVSKAVKQLEDELGVQLLDRVGPRPKLTSAGEVVYGRASAMLAESADLLTELDEVRGLKRGTLSLGLPLIGANLLFAPLFAAYRSQYPGVDIRLFEHGSKRLERLLLAGEVDFAASLLPVGDEFEWLELRRERIDVLVPENHPLARRKNVRMADLAKFEFILFGEAFALNPIILGACQRAGFQPTVVARSSQIDFILELVRVRMGIAFLPRMVATMSIPKGVRNVAISDEGMRWDLALIWRRGAYLSQAARAWLELAKQSRKGD